MRHALSTINNDVEDSSFYRNYFLALEKSDFLKAEEMLLNRNFERHQIYSNYYLFLPKSDNATAIDFYLSYRFSESQGDIDNIKLLHLLTDAYGSLNLNDGLSECINYLLRIEVAYISMYDENGILNYARNDSLRQFVGVSNAIGRAEFLWSKVNYEARNFDESIMWWYPLLAAQKYEKDVLRLNDRLLFRSRP